MARDTYRLVIGGVSGGEFWESVQHFESGVTNSTDPLTDASNCVTMWRDNLENSFLDCVPSAVTIVGYKCARVNNGGGPTFMAPVGPLSGARTGTLANSCLGPCLVSPFDNTVRWSAGKWFLPGVTQTDLTSNHFSSALLALVATFATALANTYTEGTTWDFCIYSKKLSAPIIPFDIEISLKAGVQKRRLTPVV